MHNILSLNIDLCKYAYILAKLNWCQAVTCIERLLEALFPGRQTDLFNETLSTLHWEVSSHSAVNVQTIHAYSCMTSLHVC